MDWITDNIEGIMGAFTALYALVRAVVALTPTKADDKYLSKARGTWRKVLSIFAAVYGLDIEQGRKEKDDA